MVQRIMLVDTQALIMREEEREVCRSREKPETSLNDPRLLIGGTDERPDPFLKRAV